MALSLIRAEGSIIVIVSPDCFSVNIPDCIRSQKSDDNLAALSLLGQGVRAKQADSEAFLGTRQPSPGYVFLDTGNKLVYFSHTFL